VVIRNGEDENNEKFMRATKRQGSWEIASHITRSGKLFFFCEPAILELKLNTHGLDNVSFTHDS
jgi:hypothetical protein